MVHLVGHTQNDIPVYVDLVGSEAARHISRQPYLLTLAAEALRRAKVDTLDKTTVSLEQDMERVIGYDFVIPTTPTDSVFFVQLVQDDTYTRFVKNGKPLPTSHLSIVLRRSQDAKEGDIYKVHDIWIGHLSPPRPGDSKETDDSKSYWEDHAFVFENQPIQSRTLTKTCPY